MNFPESDVVIIHRATPDIPGATVPKFARRLGEEAAPFTSQPMILKLMSSP